MTEHLDWRKLLKLYMQAVIDDDDIIAGRCADPSNFRAKPHEKAAVWELFIEAWREENPDEPDPITQVEYDAIPASKRALDKANFFETTGDRERASLWRDIAKMESLKGN